MKLIKREYLKDLIDVIGTPDIKIITGVRRSGKSKLLEMFKNYIIENIKNYNIIGINFNLVKFDNLRDYISLNNYILSGMPCDRANSVTEKNEDYIIYEQNGCIHRKNYENGQGNLEYLYELRDLWVKTFMESLNTKYLYEKEKLDDKTINKIRKA